MGAVVATLPILLTLVLLVARLPGWVPPAAGTGLAVVLGIFWFDAPVGDFLVSFDASFWTLVEVLAIIAGGILLSRVMERTGAQRRLANWLSAGGPSVASALLMANGVVPFMETVTGFGVAVIIGLPLLLSFGFTPYRAAMLTLVGLMIGPWGSMGPGTLIAADTAGTDLTQMGLMSAWYNLVPFLISGIAAAILAGRGLHHQVGAARLLGWAGTGLLSGLVLWVLVLGSNAVLGTPVAGAVATLVMSVGWLLIIRRGGLLPGPGRSLLPFLMLVAGTIFGQLLTRSVDVGAFGAVLSTPALWSTLASLVGLWILSIERAELKKLPREAAAIWSQVAIPTGLYVLLGVMVAGGGLAQQIASSLQQFGSFYLFLMPFVAGFSGYITASGAGANAMVGTTQAAAASALNVSPGWAMAMQNSAAGWAIIASPARIELAYRLAAPYQRLDTPGPVLSRGTLFKGTMPLVLLALVIFGLINLVFLPMT